MDIMQVLQSFGFPCACLVALGWYVKHITDQFREDVKQMVDSYNKNTLVLQKLCDKIGVDKEEGDSDDGK